MTILFDLIAEPVSYATGVSPVILLAVIIVIEALVLRSMKWRGIGLCFLDSTLMNLASALVGLLIFSVGLALPVWVVAFLLSVVIEGGVLLLLKRHPARRTWLASLVANAASYAVVLIVVVLNVRL